jgi:AhpD family alkylhydroperoxidase
MKKIEVFDPAMCCSTGVCGTTVDPDLARFASNVEWLVSVGISVSRFNLAQQPEEFVKREIIRELLNVKGDKYLPVILADGELVSEGSYPDRPTLAAIAGLVPDSSSLYTSQVAELVAIGAAIGSNCESCLQYHIAQAIELGVTRADMGLAIKTARRVKDTPARNILKLADQLLNNDHDTDVKSVASTVGQVVAPDSCCSSKAEVRMSDSDAKGCC